MSRGLRIILALSFPVSFGILLAHGIVSRQVFPALGTIPLFASSLLSVLLLRRPKSVSLDSPRRHLTPAKVFMLDIALAIFHLCMLITSCALMVDDTWHSSRVIASNAILGTYGTVFMMVDFLIHVYLAAKFVTDMFNSRSCDCAHCRSVTGRDTVMPVHAVGSTPERMPFLSHQRDTPEAEPDVEAGTISPKSQGS